MNRLPVARGVRQERADHEAHRVPLVSRLDPDRGPLHLPVAVGPHPPPQPPVEQRRRGLDAPEPDPRAVRPDSRLDLHGHLLLDPQDGHLQLGDLLGGLEEDLRAPQAVHLRVQLGLRADGLARLPLGLLLHRGLGHYAEPVDEVLEREPHRVARSPDLDALQDP